MNISFCSKISNLHARRLQSLQSAAWLPSRDLVLHSRVGGPDASETLRVLIAAMRATSGG